MSILPECLKLVRELESLCPGAIFKKVSLDEIKILVPMRRMQASQIMDRNVVDGRDPYTVDLIELGMTPLEWFEHEIAARRGPTNPDFIKRLPSGEAISIKTFRDDKAMRLPPRRKGDYV